MIVVLPKLFFPAQALTLLIQLNDQLLKNIKVDHQIIEPTHSMFDIIQ